MNWKTRGECVKRKIARGVKLGMLSEGGRACTG